MTTVKARAALAVIVLLAMSACTSAPEHDRSFTPTVTGPAEMPAVEKIEKIEKTPSCLSIQEGDRHIEFNGTDLFLAEEGTPKKLELNSGDEVFCEKLEVIRGAKRPSVFIQYRTRQAGTSIGISDLIIAIASIADAKWTLAPTVLVRHFEQASGPEDETRHTFHWKTSNDAPDPAALVLTDQQTHKSKTIRP